mgnify:FL=1
MQIDIEYLNVEPNEKYEEIISKVLNKCFEEENLPQNKLSVSISLTDLKNIRNLNCKHRNIDKETDVLSFPMFEKEEIDKKVAKNDFQIEDILGDMVICIPKVEEQAEEYGHSFERELSYMVVHSFYHLMGYDHMEEEPKKEMRQKEEYILKQLGITRENK